MLFPRESCLSTLINPSTPQHIPYSSPLVPAAPQFTWNSLGACAPFRSIRAPFPGSSLFLAKPLLPGTLTCPFSGGTIINMSKGIPFCLGPHRFLLKYLRVHLYIFIWTPSSPGDHYPSGVDAPAHISGDLELWCPKWWPLATWGYLK